jgi:signal transduction histidine kinase
MRPGELVNDLADLLQPALEHRGIDLQVAIDFSKVIDADQDRLQQALINLVNNAADELKDGGTILMGTRLTENPATIEFRVEDSGPGVSAISDKQESDKPFGLGLGLAICREIAEIHGGALIVDASPTLGGARFAIRLPLSQEQN